MSDHRKLRYMARIRWQDRVASAEVAKVEELEAVLARERLQRFEYKESRGGHTAGSFGKTGGGKMRW